MNQSEAIEKREEVEEHVKDLVYFITNGSIVTCGEHLRKRENYSGWRNHYIIPFAKQQKSTDRVAAHWTPSSGELGMKMLFKYDDVMKLDFGTHIYGHIVDCAFTVALNPMFDPLLEASREATNTGVLRKLELMCAYAMLVLQPKRSWSRMRSRSTERCSKGKNRNFSFES
ncbi:hypothetical protein ACS0TY_023325 [Phlomoides rotata]